MEETSAKRKVELTEDTIPALKSTEVLIKIRAVSINYTDLMLLDGTFPLSIPRVIPCSDFAGDVVAVGQEVTSVNIGDRVTAGRLPYYLDGTLTSDGFMKYGSGLTMDGVLTEYKVLPAETLVTVPENLSYEEASTLPCVAVTAYNCLLGGAKKMEKGDTVLVLGSGAVSLFAAQFALAVGAEVIFTTSSEEKVQKLRELGYTKVVNYKANSEWEKEVLELTNGRGVEHVIENGGTGTLAKSISCIAMGGWIHIVGLLGERSSSADIAFQAIMKTCVLRGVFVGPASLFREMNEFIAQRQLRPPIASVFEFDKVPEAYQYLTLRDDSGKLGKVVIRVA